MGNNDKNSKVKDETAESGSSQFVGLLPFLLVAAVIVAIAVMLVNSFSEADKQQLDANKGQVQETQDLRKLHEEFVAREALLREEVRESNIELGIDPEFPSFRFPIYEGMEILESKREESSSTLGEKMDMWFVKGQVDAELDDIQQFYRDRLQEEGMRQTQYISIPGGYAFNYADEWYDTRFAIEQQASDPLPRVEITVYRVQDDSVKIGE